jgi:hypothetical protein
MIVRGLIGSLRVNVERTIPAESPFSCLGTRPILDMDGLHRSFTQAHTLQISAPRARRKSSISGADRKGESEMVLKVTKVGLVSRKGVYGWGWGADNR